MSAEANPVTHWLRRLVEAGASDTYPCRCEARGRIVECRPGIFVITYEHDDWCPKVSAGAAGANVVGNNADPIAASLPGATRSAAPGPWSHVRAREWEAARALSAAFAGLLAPRGEGAG